MHDVNYDKIQAEIVRESRLCRHCGRCMPIIDGENYDSHKIDTDAIRGPVSVWDDYPEICGYTGWLFWEREKQKHLIRKLKEEIYFLSFLDKDAIVAKNLTARKRIKSLNAQIKPWLKHGAENW